MSLDCVKQFNTLESVGLLRVKVNTNSLRDGNIMHSSPCLILTARLERVFDYIISLFSLRVSCRFLCVCVCGGFFFSSVLFLCQKRYFSQLTVKGGLLLARLLLKSIPTVGITGT